LRVVWNIELRWRRALWVDAGSHDSEFAADAHNASRPSSG
jgi:hypothetical protein